MLLTWALLVVLSPGRLRWRGRRFFLRRAWFRLILLWGTCFLRRFWIRIPNALPQPFQRVGAGLWAEPVIRAQSLHDGLDDFFLDPICASIPLPIIEHFGESADDGAVAVSVFVFESEKFA
jgi:hypothetical protein